MKEIIKKVIDRESGYDYRIDRHGNLIKEKYNYFKDWKTYLVILLALMGFLYYSEVKTARDYIGSPCVHKCLVQEYISDFKAKNPNIKLDCDDEGNCHYSGVIDYNLQKQVEELMKYKINITNG